MIRRITFVVLALCLLGLWLMADRWKTTDTVAGTSVIIKDGDTLMIAGRTFRLYGIDAPEYSQTCLDSTGKDWPCGKAARMQLAALASPGSLTCEILAKDVYARDVARCASATVPDLGASMVQSGMAISPAERGTAPYEEQETSARAAKRGIWQGSFEVPSEWRADHERGSA